MTDLLEKYNFRRLSVNFRRPTAKSKRTHAAIVETFNKELEKQLFKTMDAPELQDPKNVSAITVKNLNSIVRKTRNTKSLNNSYVTKV